MKLWKDREICLENLHGEDLQALARPLAQPELEWQGFQQALENIEQIVFHEQPIRRMEQQHQGIVVLDELGYVLAVEIVEDFGPEGFLAWLANRPFASAGPRAAAGRSTCPAPRR